MELPLVVALREDLSVDSAIDPALSADDLLFLFRKMLLLRAFDEKAIALQRAGRIGFFVPSFGQEAAEAGSAFALRDGDWILPQATSTSPFSETSQARASSRVLNSGKSRDEKSSMPRNSALGMLFAPTTAARLT